MIVLGGKDDYDWSLESDLMLELYGTENRFKLQESPPLLPQSRPYTSPYASPRMSRSSSVSSMGSSVFYDAPEYISRRPSSHYEIIRSTFTSAAPSIYGTPGTLTPINAYNRQQVAIRPPLSEPRYFLNGFHMGETFLTSFFRMGNSNANQQISIDGNDLTHRLNLLLSEEGIHPEDFVGELEGIDVVNNPLAIAHFPHMLPASHPQSIYVTSPLKHQLMRVEQRMLRYSRKLFHMSFAYKGALYWVLLYCFLRGPVEKSLEKSLAKIMAGTTKEHITFTTIGVTATVAAALSASLSSSLENNTSPNKRNSR